MLKHRIVSGSALGAVLILVLNLLPACWLAIILVLVSAMAQLEFYSLMNRAGIPVFRMLGVVCGTGVILATFASALHNGTALTASYRFENIALVLAMMAVFVRQFPQKHNEKPLETLGCTLLGIFYVPYLLNYLSRLSFAWEGSAWDERITLTGRLLVLYMIVVVKFADIGAFFAGSKWGRHKLFARVSPGKTWEGLAGGVALSVLVSLLFVFLCGGRLGELPIPWIHAVMLGVILSITGVTGDMFESLLKRSAGAKDSSAALPGMGGLLDVLDSLLFSAPVMYIYFHAFL